MDLILLTFLTAAIAVFIVIFTLLIRRSSNETLGDSKAQPQARENNRQVRRAVGNRHVRRRLQEASFADEGEPNRSEHEHEQEQEQDRQENSEKVEISEQKIGTKKRAKLEAKAEKKAQREALDREREERQKKEQLLLAEKDKENERAAIEELKRKEAERKAREEKERKEYEQYLKMKELFSVEEEGYEEESAEDTENLLQKFIDYIKKNKVLLLEDLAAHFHLKVAFVVDRIQELQLAGNLTGVIDDRGKFIYISQEELNAVAKFVRQRGRISITELAENSNHLINMNCEQSLKSR